MLKIVGYNINPDKKILYSLCNVYGIGRQKSLKLCVDLNINPVLKWREINTHLRDLLITTIEKKIKTGHHVFLEKQHRINVYKKNGSLRGYRHKNNLPVRGQRTHSNAKTPKRLARLIKQKK